MEDQPHELWENLPHLTFGKFLIDGLGYSGMWYGASTEPVNEQDITATTGVSTEPQPIDQDSRRVARDISALYDEIRFGRELDRWQKAMDRD